MARRACQPAERIVTVALGEFHGDERGDQARQRIAPPEERGGHEQADRYASLGPQHGQPASSGAVRRQVRHLRSKARGVISREAEEDREEEQSQRSDDGERDGHHLEQPLVASVHLCPGERDRAGLQGRARNRSHGRDDQRAVQEEECQEPGGQVAHEPDRHELAGRQRPGYTAPDPTGEGRSSEPRLRLGLNLGRREIPDRSGGQGDRS